MHFFGLLVMIALGIYALEVLGSKYYKGAAEARPLVSLILGLVFAWVANINLWTGWTVANLRADWIGVTLTGFALGGLALLADAVIGFFAGLHRMYEDRAEHIERTELKRIA